MKPLTYFLLLALFISNIGDLTTTMAGLSLGGYELNQTIYPYGLQIFYLFKILYPTLVVIFASILNEYIEKYNNKSAIWTIRIFVLAGTCGFTYCIINNLSTILRILHF